MTMRNSFEDGKLAGQKLLKLFDDIGQSFPLKPAPFKTTEEVLQKVWSWSSNNKPYEVVLGFFSEILTLEGYDGNILYLWGANQFLHDQEDCAPTLVNDRNYRHISNSPIIAIT